MVFGGVIQRSQVVFVEVVDFSLVLDEQGTRIGVAFPSSTNESTVLPLILVRVDIFYLLIGRLLYKLKVGFILTTIIKRYFSGCFQRLHRIS